VAANSPLVIARPLWAASLRAMALGLAGAIALAAIGGLWSAQVDGFGVLTQVTYLVLGAGFAVAGYFVCEDAPRSRVGALMVLGGTGLLAASAGAWVLDAAGVQRIAIVSAAIPIALAVLLFPDGRLIGAPGALAALACVGVAVAGVIAPRSDTVVGNALFALALVLLCAQWWRFESGDDATRRALLWILLALGAVALIGAPLYFAAPNALGTALALLLLLGVPVALTVGAVAPDVTDVRALIARSLLYGLTSMLVIAVFTAAAALIGALGDGPGSPGALSLVAVGCALLFQPTRTLLRGVVTPLLFGDRLDPVSAASHVGDRMSDDPVAALRALREVLAVPYAQLSDESGPIAASGQPSTELRRLPLHIGAVGVGTLTVGLRPGEVRLTEADSSVLRIVAPALAQVVRSRALAAQLHESRGRLIAAVEDERRRLRRDLHDELGPTLTGVAYAADAARNLVNSDPLGAVDLLAGLRAETARAIADIRRLVHGLRPPALDELGLAQAVSQRASSMFAADGSALQVEVDVPAVLPELPAAVEVAAYRIVVEALTNVSRHAATDRAWVQMAVVDSALVVQVRDAGASSGQWLPGVGMRSMRERAEALGGSVGVTSGPAGAMVSARLPL
jgi:two-component system NarL family sensor kinase